MHEIAQRAKPREKTMGNRAESCTWSSPLITAGIVVSLFLGGFALSPTIAAPRTAETEKTADKKNAEQYIELVRRDLRQDRREIIGEALALNPTEAEAFWPVYERYEAELNRLGDEKLALINDYADNYKTMTEAKAGELTRKAIDLDILRTSLLQQYLPQFQKVLTNRRAAQFYQIEMPLLKIVDLQIAAQLPMMP
ncbi:hypothetical protein JL100_022185 [Skermanella mucosa]|uniref:hypothetical protein n=1 Tax=Skermanella mucosa TaxID=1789672 RepID=UPI00192C2476|nr:hypothetical protein [Skermanella mucosa]UEM19770.1 hypothetical protein JL100_022185 [Skermanella mucosa]